ncbi:MAG TPA: hypothetical protein VF692_03115 [Pyrinomonadaceae bacterium]|jgi:hypothetical protein
MENNENNVKTGSALFAFKAKRSEKDSLGIEKISLSADFEFLELVKIRKNLN